MIIKMSFPAELKDEIARVLAEEKKIFGQGANNPAMKVLDTLLKAATGVPKEINIHAIDFSYSITSETTAELFIITPVESMTKPEWIANRIEKEFVKADPRIKFELVKEK